MKQKKTTISVYVDKKQAKELERRAKSLRISTSKYIVIVLEKHIECGEELVLTEE